MKSKYLNKLSISITAFSLLFALGSCKKYLDQQPITSVGPDQVFSDVPTTLQALVGVYDQLTADQGYGNRLSLEYTADNDLLMGPSGTQDDRRALAHYSLTPLNSELSPVMNQLFRGIMLANICIDNIPKMDLYKNGSDQQKKQLQRMLGEALTLRAQFYFEAIRNWGDMPAHFLPSSVEAVENAFPTRTDRNVIYDHILDDLKQAEAIVPWRNEVTSIGDQIDERITKGTVKALRARIALFRGGYALPVTGGALVRPSNYLDFYKIARDETNDIITSGQHSLYPDYKALWRDVVDGHQTVDPNGELMFQVTAIGGGSTADSKLGYANGPRVNGQGTSLLNPLPHYLYLFDSTDVRRDVTIAPYDVNTDLSKVGQKITNMRDGKYRRDWIKNPVISPTDKAQYFGLKWQILRYSDVLLMFAEAENEINGPTSATGSVTPYTALNMVRRRAYGLPLNAASANDIPAGLDKATFFKYLVRERALEFGGEGIRKFDMIRWNLLATGIAEARTNMSNMASRTGTIGYSYMAGGPSYATNPATLPASMYYKTTSTADDASIWANSLYKTSPTSTPGGTKSVGWVSTTISTDITNATRYAFGFSTGKSELLPIPQGARDANPNLSQNNGY